MNGKRWMAAVAGALVAGLVLGSVVSGYAATTPSAAQTSAPGLGLRLGAAMRDSGGRLLDVVAKLTGKTTTAVVAERQAGKTFSQIAAESGVSSSKVVDEALKTRQQILATKVSAGAITQAQADSALTTMKTRLTSRVDTVNTSCNGTGSGGGRGAGAGRGSGGGMGGRGSGGGSCGACTAAQ